MKNPNPAAVILAMADELESQKPQKAELVRVVLEENYAMVRRPGCSPYVAECKDLECAR